MSTIGKLPLRANAKSAVEAFSNVDETGVMYILALHDWSWQGPPEHP